MTRPALASPAWPTWWPAPPPLGPLDSLSDRAYRLHAALADEGARFGPVSADPERLRALVWWGRPEVTAGDVAEALAELQRAGLAEVGRRRVRLVQR